MKKIMHKSIKFFANKHTIGLALLSLLLLALAPLWSPFVPKWVVYVHFSVFSFTVAIPLLIRMLLLLSASTVVFKKRSILANYNLEAGQIITVKKFSRDLNIPVLESFYLLQLISRGDAMTEKSSTTYECN